MAVCGGTPLGRDRLIAVTTGPPARFSGHLITGDGAPAGSAWPGLAYVIGDPAPY
ncbi:hypothetical protein [Streptosporangium sp. KLBMP 9127]|nr:hypothetical protein [Streptosporangium sp. KLBMP 9127]